MSTPEKTESLDIEQDNKKFTLTIKIKGEEMALFLSELEIIGNSTFIKKMTLKEIKELHYLFGGLPSCNKFSDYLKGLKERKKLSLMKKEDYYCIILNIEYMLNNESIELILLPEKKNSDQLINDLCKEVNFLKEENKELKNIINNLKKDNHNLKEEIKKFQNIIEPIEKKLKEININRYTTFNNKSTIMKENEFDLIHNAIKTRLNKEVKEIKKLYQATIDGDCASNFHSKCDGIPYTLVIIKSAGNRRFGGFTSKCWEANNSGKNMDDQNAFLFSLDKQKIYPYKNNGSAIYYHRDYGPTFGNTYDINIGSKCIQEKSSYTYESYSSSCYNYSGDNNALSEDGQSSGIYISEYEVFQILFV